MRRRQFLTAAGVSLAGRLPALAQNKPRLPRKDCFFGIHFDLHPNPNDKALGRDLSPEMVDRFLTAVAPDYVQYDCKGHVGYLGYPSKVGTPAPNIVQDSLAIWRKATAQKGVGLYIHFSGVWDSRAILDHPEWANTNPDGKRDPNATSLFGPYLDELMIPELLEAAEKYDLDGVWIDGECWSTRPDYGETAAQAFRDATGVRELPKKITDPGWQRFIDFHRARFRQYVRHYCDVIHAQRPKFQIASNWLYTTYVPEKPDLPVDFLSGDYLGNASISTARLDGRYLSSVGKPWDLMAWGFQRATPRTLSSLKPAPQLQQEAAVVLAQGGGFQVYYNPTRTGHVDERNIATMAKLAKFCRARQSLSHKSESVPQIGVLFSTNSLYTTVPKMFGGWGANADPARGIVDALVDSQFSVDVIPEWRFDEMSAKYPLMVIPDWPAIGARIQQAVEARVKSGGKTLIVGAQNARLFADLLGVRFAGEASDQNTMVLGDEIFGQAKGLWQPVELAGAEIAERRFPDQDATRGAQIAATVRGSVAGVYGPAGVIYAISHTAAMRQFLRRVVTRIFTPAVRVEGAASVEVALRRKDGLTLVHLVNCAGMQVAAEYMSQDFIPPVGPLTVSLRTGNKPRSVMLQPDGRALQGSWSNGVWTGVVPKLEIHSVLAFA